MCCERFDVCDVAAITKRKIELRDEAVVRAINAFDLKTLPTERVEILQRILPNDKEVKAFKDYEAQRKPVDVLADEDKFLYSVRLSVHLFVRESVTSAHCTTVCLCTIM